jgi:S1-C subfamily serine protease
VAKFDEPGIRFHKRDGYPGAVWFATEAKVVKKWDSTIDLALVRFKIDKEEVPVLPLAAPGQRPKTFPAKALSVGATEGTVPTVEAETIAAKKLVRSEKDPEQVAFFWEMERPTTSGRSGGPLLDANGRVIGVCIANQFGKGYFVHLDEILAALKRDDGEYSWLVPKGS